MSKKSIRTLLPYGAISRIAKKTGKSYSTVNNVIDGKSDNEDVLLAIEEEIKKAQKKKSDVADLRQRILKTA